MYVLLRVYFSCFVLHFNLVFRCVCLVLFLEFFDIIQTSIDLSFVARAIQSESLAMSIFLYCPLCQPGGS